MHQDQRGQCQRGRGDAGDLTSLAQKAGAGSVRFRLPEGQDAVRATAAARSAVGAGIARIDARRVERERMIADVGDAPAQPWIYLIVATGDIYEDIPQAQAAAREGADIIAVIRSTGQSLLDFVPEGATREGFAGTYATQENFRLMRAALDETGGGTVTGTEVDDEESKYEVEVTLDDGSEVDVQLDEDFQVVGTEREGAEDETGDDD